jgi:membrane protease YdiL (CAAX protease family)
LRKLVAVTDFGKAQTYYTITLALCLALTALAPQIGRRTPDIAMFIPLAAVSLMLLVFTRDGYSKDGWRALGLHRSGMDQWALALSVPLAVLGLAYGVVWVSGVAAVVIPDDFGSIPWFLLDLIFSIAIVTIVVAVSEEIGWRGYLLPHLTGLGVWKAVLFSGALHALFHVPIIIWTPFYHGVGNRLIILPLFLLTLTVAGICYGYLRLSTASVWPASIAHSAFNIFWARFNAFTVSNSPDALEYLAGESGIVTLLGLVIVAGWLARRLRKFEGINGSTRAYNEN